MTMVRGQLQLGTTAVPILYGGSATQLLTDTPIPDADRTIITHEVPLSLYWPQKDLGPKPPTIAGELFLPEADVASFMTDCGNAAAGERKIQWFDGGVQVYAYVRTGVCTRARYGTGLSSRWVLVKFSFISTRTAVYLAATDAIVWGGS